MISTEPLHSLSDYDETESNPRISFSSEFFDESNFITIFPNPQAEREEREARPAAEWSQSPPAGVDFEFLSENLSSMIAADELFSEGKLLPFRQIHRVEKLSTISFEPDGADEVQVGVEPSSKKDKMTWFLDDDPSPRPPKCTVLWKELLKLKKQRPSMLSPSNSFSSSSSSSSSRTSAMDVRGEATRNSEKCSKRLKKGKERTRSVSIRIRPVLNVPICTQAKNAAMPPLFSLRKGR